MDMHEAEAEATVRMMHEPGSPPAADCIVVGGNVTVPNACESAVRAALGRWGRIDILVNNVAVPHPNGTAVTTDLSDWDRGMGINVTSMVLMAKFVIPEMKANGGGAIINLSSIVGVRGGGKSLMYATSKGAVVNLTRMMAFQHGADGIRVNAIIPGSINTPMSEADGMTDERREARRLRSLLRTEGTAWDVAHAAVYLASDEARWVTGILLPVDGGFLAADPST
jgi:NAD(P)-dependent dehydrogenase (short-subunit alcohol dehydrogenase family)